MMEFHPKVCRLRILNYLEASALAEVSVVSTRLRNDCLAPSLPQERTAVIRIPEDCPHGDRRERLRTCLIKMGATTPPDGQRKSQKFSPASGSSIPTGTFGPNATGSPQSAQRRSRTCWRSTGPGPENRRS
jgi:hypothetical protein